MERKIETSTKLTNFKWLNLFGITARNAKGKLVKWIFASRKEDPLNNNSVDAVVIIPIINTVEGKKVVIIKEYRWPINGVEYGFPAGLIEDGLSIEETVAKELKEETGLDLVKIITLSNPVYSSPGLTDESCVMVFVECDGEISTSNQEDTEEIEVMALGVEEITQMLKDPDKRIGAKAWGVLYYYSKAGFGGIE